MVKEEAFKEAFNQLIDSNKSLKNYDSYNGRFDHLMYFQSSTNTSPRKVNNWSEEKFNIISGTSTLNRKVKPPRPPPPATSRYSMLLNTSKMSDDIMNIDKIKNNNDNINKKSQQKQQQQQQQILKNNSKNKNKFYCDSSSDSSFSHYTQKSLYVSECFNNDDKLDRLLGE